MSLFIKYGHFYVDLKRQSILVYTKLKYSTELENTFLKIQLHKNVYLFEIYDPWDQQLVGNKIFLLFSNHNSKRREKFYVRHALSNYFCYRTDQGGILRIKKQQRRIEAANNVIKAGLVSTQKSVTWLYCPLCRYPN